RAIATDRRVDELEAEIDAKAVKILSRREHFAGDLRACVGAIKIATDLERIGDLAKNVAKRTIDINSKEPVRSSYALVGMGRQALLQLTEVLNAFAQKDMELALSVWRRDHRIDHLYNSLFRELLTYMMEDPRTIGPCTHLLFIAKNIERIGDHATNIAEIVHYMIAGEYIKEDRPKLEQVAQVDFGSEPDAAGGATDLLKTQDTDDR
ncbi:MAG: phosphate signaling complex protein PhoU, partial [Pseudomonadota bacterium]